MTSAFQGDMEPLLLEKTLHWDKQVPCQMWLWPSCVLFDDFRVSGVVRIPLQDSDTGTAGRAFASFHRRLIHDGLGTGGAAAASWYDGRYCTLSTVSA